MSRICWWLTNKLSRTLPQDQQDALRGDFAELGLSGTKALWELLGFMLRQEAAPWLDWRPWLALFGVVGLVGVSLARVSFWVSAGIGFEMHFIKFGIYYRNGLSLTKAIIYLTCQCLVLALWCWVAGFTMGSLSRRTVRINEVVLGGVWFVVWFLWALTPGLIWLVYISHHRNLLASTLWDFLLSLLVPAIFFVHVIWGARQGVRLGTLRLRSAFVWAAIIVIVTALATWTSGWREAHSLVWSGGGWSIHKTSWETRLLPFSLVSWPLAYMVATACWQHWRKEVVVS